MNVKEQDKSRAIGGMRKPQKSLSKLPLLVDTGRRLRATLEEALHEHPLLDPSCLAAIGDKEKAKDISEESLG